jgi:hypothetical protein
MDDDELLPTEEPETDSSEADPERPRRREWSGDAS